jgi:hypothetical protein
MNFVESEKVFICSHFLKGFQNIGLREIFEKLEPKFYLYQDSIINLKLSFGQ